MKILHKKFQYLRPFQRYLLIQLKALAGDKDTVSININELSELTGITVSTVKVHIKKLVDKNYILIHRNETADIYTFTSKCDA